MKRDWYINSSRIAKYRGNDTIIYCVNHLARAKLNREVSALETQVFQTSDLRQSEIASENGDLGLSGEVANRSKRRLLNADGTFNVKREGFNLFRSSSVYLNLLTTSWSKFSVIVVSAYVFVNFFFAMLYFIAGRDALKGAEISTPLTRLADCFFFSVQTLATIGYGRITPDGFFANIIVTVEAFVGLLGFALATGLLFARISRPSAAIAFSKHAVIAPYHGITAFEFRIANERQNQLIHLDARVVMSRMERDDLGTLRRKFHQLELERRQIMFFPLHWTIVHPITQNSPLYTVTAEQLAASDAEFMILLSGIDDAFSQKVHTWRSYKHDQVIWGKNYKNILEETAEGSVRIDLARLDELAP